MEMRLVRRVIAGLIHSIIIFVLTGCGTEVLHPTPVRYLPLDVEAQLSQGDSRQKVHSVLGKPLIDAKNLGLEVYRQIGRDINISLPGVPIPIPEPGEKVIVIVLVTYDEQDLVKETASRSWSPDQGLNYCITAGGYSFVNAGKHFGRIERSPATLLGQANTWEVFEGKATTEGECSLVLLMGKCPMEVVLLDDSRIIDLSPAGGYCSSDLAGVRRENNYYGNNYYGTYIRLNISPGNHRLDIRQKTKHGNFEKYFSCESGETVYAELQVNTVDDWWYGTRLEGEISVKKSTPNNVVEMGELRPILWHRGTWYGPPTSNH